MKAIDVDKRLRSLSEQLTSLGLDPVILTRKGKPIGVWLPVKGADLETVSLSFNPRFLEIIEESKRQFYQGEVFSDEEIRGEFGIPPANNRKSPNSKRKVKTKAGRK